MAAITAVALVVVGGSVGAWAMLAHPAPAAAAASTSVASTSAAAIPDPPAPATTTQIPVAATPVPAAIVSLSGAAADQPSAPQVQELLERHFSAINDLDYAAWTATVTPARAHDQTAAAWTQGYRSSHDSDVTITEIDPVGPRSVTVYISFVSVQDPQDAPADLPVDRICWTQQIPVSGVGTDPRLGLPPKGTSTRSAC